MRTTSSTTAARVPHIPVTSTTIASAGYVPEEQVLELRFKSGENYSYFDVPAPVHAALLAAGSKGRYFNEAIRGRFTYRRA